MLEPLGVLGSVTNQIPSDVQTAIEAACEAAGVALISAVVRGNERQMHLEIAIDSTSGVTHDHCRAVSRFIDERLESDDFYGRLRAVDVSSPGADAPVKFLWQLTKHVGRVVGVKRTDGSAVEGKLLEVNDKGLVVLPKAKGKQQVEPMTIDRDDVVEARVIIQF